MANGVLSIIFPKTAPETEPRKVTLSQSPRGAEQIVLKSWNLWDHISDHLEYWELVLIKSPTYLCLKLRSDSSISYQVKLYIEMSSTTSI